MPDVAASPPPTLRIMACHQPNFFPWLGYFHKIRWAETFIILDDAFVNARAGTYTNRTSLAPGGKQRWYTAPIDRSESGPVRIDRLKFAPREPFRDRLLALLKTCYGRAPFFDAVWSTVTRLVADPEPLLAAYNQAAIRAIAASLELPAKLVPSSSLGVDATSTERLVELAQAVGADTYLYGGGAKDYQDDALFGRKGIHLYEQGFEPPAYPRGPEPSIAGLSILDALFFLGPAGTRALLDVPPPTTGLRLAGGA